MAIDEAIVASVATVPVGAVPVGAVPVPATLRFYGWSRPTLSLGYFQSIADASAWSHQPVDLVRRHSGGGAIMHDHELTYSLSLPLTQTGPGARESVYRTVHQCIIESLRERGVIATTHRDRPSATAASVQVQPTGLRVNQDEPFLCFQRRTDEDLICGGYKILGSAQRRVRGGVLQHGSLLLQTSRHAEVLPGVNELSAVSIDPSDIAEGIAKRIATAMSIDWQFGVLTDQELAASERIRDERYASDHWTQRR